MYQVRKVRDYLNFEKVKAVVDIDSDLKDNGGKYLIEKYVISENIKSHLENIAENISQTKHKSLQIIGSYGSGKSHLLGFLLALFENKDNISLIQNEKIRKLFYKKLTRNFMTVQFELHSNEKDLGEIFFFRIRNQLKSKYGIEIPKKDYKEIIDYKEEIDEILKYIKAKNPENGLVVVIDEISDFMKGKNTKAAKVRDTQFLRVIAQKSQDCDFMLIGAMQEQVFTNPEFIDDADSLGRVYERFDVINISREDIKTVVSNRILNKTQDQKEDLGNILEDIANKIPAVRNKLDEFINLYPVHPKVIDIFNELPVFETRGVIKFIMDNVSKILESSGETFVTFDKIYDQIAESHTIRNLDEIAPIIDAVNTLVSKTDTLNKDQREETLRIIKALAILKLQGRNQNNNGATAEELAEDLMIITGKLDPVDRVKVILKKLRDATDGQFIREGNGYYFIDVENQVDYDLVIKRKSENLPNGAENEELLKLISEKFNLSSNEDAIKRTISDTCLWQEKNSYREGFFLFDDGETSLKKENGDFYFVFRSPIARREVLASNSNTGVLITVYNEEIYNLLRYIAATNYLVIEGKYARSTMQKRNIEYKKELEKKLTVNLMESEIEINSIKRKIKDVLSHEPNGLPEFYEEVKRTIFQNYFNESYSAYPKFSNHLTRDNIKNEVDRTIKNIIKMGIDGLTSAEKGYLRSLGLINISGEVTLETSQYVFNLINLLKKDGNINTDIKIIKNLFNAHPYGMQDELINLMLFFITYNGQINLVKIGGGDISAAELSDFFGKSGYKAFETIRYIKQETDLPVVELKKLFKVLGINEGLLNSKDNRIKALQQFNIAVLAFDSERKNVISKLEILINNSNIYPNSATISKHLQNIRDFKLDKFKNATNPATLRNTILSEVELKELKSNLKLLQEIKGFFNDFDSGLEKEYNYLKESFTVLETRYFDAHADDFETPYKDCKEIMEDFDRVLNHEERRQLRGKLQQYKEKYQNYYFAQHQKKVGSFVNWKMLDEIKNCESYKNLKNLKFVKGINSSSFIEIESEILKIESLKCDKLKFGELKEKVICPHCLYPKNIGYPLNLSERIDEVKKKIISLSKEWEERILDEIESYKVNLSLVTFREKEIIEKIATIKKVEKADAVTVKALNQLFKDIEEKEISLEDISKVIFEDKETLTYREFEEKLENLKRFVKKDIDISNLENLRIKNSKKGEYSGR